MNGTRGRLKHDFMSILSVWVRVEQGLVFAMERPPVLDTPLPGLLWLTQLDIDLDAQTKTSRDPTLDTSTQQAPG